MRLVYAAAGLAFLGASLSAQAQTTTPAAPAPTYTRAAGEITAVSATQISVRSADGHIATMALAPQWLLVIGRPISASDIHPGDFVATANVITGDDAGRSVELRVFPPGVHLGEGSRPMADGNNMTNGTVGQVASVADGRVLDVTYPGGERHITLPSTINVIGQTLADHSALAVGWHVRVLAQADASGALTTGYVYSGVNGAEPPH
jgi:hypothetical protein